jgi:hypothetical protein
MAALTVEEDGRPCGPKVTDDGGGKPATPSLSSDSEERSGMRAGTSYFEPKPEAENALGW